MSRTSTANYDVENAKTEKSPIAIAEFTGLTRKYSSGTFSNITANHKKLIRRMRTDLLSIDILKGTANFGHTEFEVIDESLDVTTLMKDNDLEGLDVTIKVGYDNLSDSDFVSLPATKLRGPQLMSDYLTWKFVTRDVIAKLDKKIFVNGPRTTVSTAYTSGGTTLEVADTTDFHAFPPSGQPQHDWMQAHIKVGGDVMVYTGTGAGPTRFTGINNGQLGSANSDHAVGDEVRQVFGLSKVNPMHMLLVVLLSGNPNTGNTADNHKFYDVRGGDGNKMIIGLDLTSSDVNIAQIEELGWKYFEENERCSFVIGDEPVNALKWLTKNILRPSGTYLYTQDGKICVGINDWLEVNENYPASPTTIATADINPDESTMKIDHDNLINHFEIRYGSSWQKTVKVFKLDASETAYGLTDEPHVIESPLLARSANAGWISAAVARRWLYFFGNTHVDWRFNILSKNWLLEAGDNVDITFDKLPDLNAGTRGWTTMKSIITGLDVEWLPSPKFTLTGRSWEIFNRVTSFYTVTKNLTGGGNLGFNATNTAAVDIGDDQIVSLSSVSSAQVFMAFIDLTEPNTANTDDEYVSIGIHIQSASGTDNTSDNRAYVRYSPSGTAVRNLAFIVTSNAAFNPHSVKCDFYARSSAAADDPTLNFKEVWTFTLDKTITEI